MASIRVEIRDGLLVPLDDISQLEPGQTHQIVIVTPIPTNEEIAALEAAVLAPFTPEENAAYVAWLDQTAGIWTDVDLDLEAELSTMRQKDLELWLNQHQGPNTL